MGDSSSSSGARYHRVHTYSVISTAGVPSGYWPSDTPSTLRPRPKSQMERSQLERTTRLPGWRSRWMVDDAVGVQRGEAAQDQKNVVETRNSQRRSRNAGLLPHFHFQRGCVPTLDPAQRAWSRRRPTMNACLHSVCFDFFPRPTRSSRAGSLTLRLLLDRRLDQSPPAARPP